MSKSVGEEEGAKERGVVGKAGGGLLGKPQRKGDCGNLHGIRARRLMPSSSGTFSSRNKRERERERERERDACTHTCRQKETERKRNIGMFARPR